MLPQTVPAFAGKRMLVVDDHHLVTELLTHVGTALGFSEIASAHDGEEALARLRTESFAVVLADINMAPMNGLHLVAAIRRDPALGTLPVILMTATQDPDLVLSAKRLGVSGFLIKPFAPQTLREQVLRVLPLV